MSLSRYAGLLGVCLLLSICTSCALPGNQETHPGGTTSVSVGPATRTITIATPTPVSTPRPGSLPLNCPVSHPTRHLLAPNYTVVGVSPVWAAWIPGSNVFHLTPPPNSPYPSDYLPPYGWQLTKVVWDVGPNYHASVTIRGHELSNHTPLLFQLDNNAVPGANAVLDPQHPGHPASFLGPQWAEWGSYIVVPKAGCYVMEVSWPTGHWSLTFAVGA